MKDAIQNESVYQVYWASVEMVTKPIGGQLNVKISRQTSVLLLPFSRGSNNI